MRLVDGYCLKHKYFQNYLIVIKAFLNYDVLTISGKEYLPELNKKGKHLYLYPIARVAKLYPDLVGIQVAASERLCPDSIGDPGYDELLRYRLNNYF
jgi:hypothetical protein